MAVVRKPAVWVAEASLVDICLKLAILVLKLAIPVDVSVSRRLETLKTMATGNHF